MRFTPPETAAQQPDFAPPRTITLTGPRVKRSFGNLWVVIGTEYYGSMGKSRFVVVDAFPSEGEAKACIVRMFGPELVRGNRKADIPIHDASRRCTPPRPH